MKVIDTFSCPHCKMQREMVRLIGNNGGVTFICIYCWCPPTSDVPISEKMRSDLVVELILLILKLKL